MSNMASVSRLNLKTVLIISLLLMTLIPFLINTPRVDADGEDWLTGWTYRRPITINGSTVEQTNYQVPIDIYNVTELFEFGDATSWTDRASQGVCTDGTYVYGFTGGSGWENNTIRKYLQDGTFILEKNINGDGWTGDDGSGDIGGGCVVGDFLYITTHIGTTQSYVVNYTLADLSYNAEYDIKTGVGEACSDVAWYAPTEKFFVMGGNNVRQVGVFNSTFDFETKYDISAFPVSGVYTSYEGISFYGDYFFAPTHAPQSDPDMTDVWLYNGSGCEPIQRIPTVIFTSTYSELALATQGIDIEEKDGTWYVWWASRAVTVPPDDMMYDIAKTELIEVGINCSSDFSDVRFTTSDGSTEFDYWLEDTDTVSHKLGWMEIPTIPSAGTTVYMYWGNTTDVSTTSNGPNTFPLLFDQFLTLDAGTWNWDGASVSGGICTVVVNNKYLGSDDSFPFTSEIAFRSYVEIGGNRRWNQGFSEAYPMTNDFAILHNQDGNINVNIQNDASTTGQQLITTYAGGTYIKNEVRLIEVSDECEGVWDESTTSAIAEASYPDESLYVGFQTWGSADDSLNIDWCLIRKFVDPEPCYASMEATETEPTDDNPTVTSFVISDLSDGDTLFKTLWYRPVMVVDDSDGLSEIGTSYFSFETDYGWHNVSYNYQTDVYAVDTETGMIMVANGYTEFSGTSLTIHFYLYLLESIDVKNNVDVYCRVTDDSSGDSDWSLEQLDYFNILDYVEDVGGSSGWTPTETPSEEPQEEWRDTDDDGIPDWDDPDIDGDWVPNEFDPDIDGDEIPNELDPEPFIPEEKEERPIMFSFKTPSGKIINIINPLYYLKPYQKIIIPFIFLLLAIILIAMYSKREEEKANKGKIAPQIRTGGYGKLEELRRRR